MKPAHCLILQAIILAGSFYIRLGKDAVITISGRIPPKTSNSLDEPTGLIRIRCSYGIHSNSYKQLSLYKHCFHRPYTGHTNGTCRVYTVNWKHRANGSIVRCQTDCKGCEHVCHSAKTSGDSRAGYYDLILPQGKCEDTGNYMCHTLRNVAKLSENQDTATLHMVPDRLTRTTSPVSSGKTTVQSVGSKLTLKCSVFTTLNVTWNWWRKRYANVYGDWQRLTNISNISNITPDIYHRCRVAWNSQYQFVVSPLHFGNLFMCRASFKSYHAASLTHLREEFYLLKPGSQKHERIFAVVFGLLVVELFMVSIFFHMQLDIYDQAIEESSLVLVPLGRNGPAGNEESTPPLYSQILQPQAINQQTTENQHEERQPPSSAPDGPQTYPSTLEESSVDATGADFSSESVFARDRCRWSDTSRSVVGEVCKSSPKERDGAAAATSPNRSAENVVLPVGGHSSALDLPQAEEGRTAGDSMTRAVGIGSTAGRANRYDSVDRSADVTATMPPIPANTGPSRPV